MDNYNWNIISPFYTHFTPFSVKITHLYSFSPKYIKIYCLICLGVRSRLVCYLQVGWHRFHVHVCSRIHLGSRTDSQHKKRVTYSEANSYWTRILMIVCWPIFPKASAYRNMPTLYIITLNTLCHVPAGTTRTWVVPTFTCGIVGFGKESDYFPMFGC